MDAQTINYDGLGSVDYVVLSALLVVSSSIGIYYRFSGGKQKTTKEYLLANQNMSSVPVAFSLMASFMSSITLLGVSSENYVYGTQFVVINLAYIVATPIAAYCYLPVFYRLQNTSAYQYLELRFGRATRLAASLAFLLQMILYMGIVVYAPALAFQAVTGLDQVVSIVAVGLVCTFYSTIGGMKAILITDVFQSLLMFGSVLCVIIKGSIDAGGMSRVWRRALEGGRIQFFDWNVDPTVRHTFWTQLVGGIFTFLSLYAVNQTQVQRLLTVGSLRKSQAALWLNWPILTALSLTTSFAGLCIYGHYAGCDPLQARRIPSADQLLPLYVVETMGHYPGVAGLFVAGIFSGSLSTVSSALNSLAAVTMQDFLVPFWFQKETDDRRLAWISQLVALTYGGVCLAIAFGAGSLGGVLQASLGIFGVVGGPLLGLFTVGMFSTAVEQKGALSGLALGLTLCAWIGFGGPKPPAPRLPQDTTRCPAAAAAVVTEVGVGDGGGGSYFALYRLSYMWLAPLGFVTTVVAAQVVSRAARRRRPDGAGDGVGAELLSPCFPAALRGRRHRLKEPALTLVSLTNADASETTTTVSSDDRSLKV